MGLDLNAIIPPPVLPTSAAFVACLTMHSAKHSFHSPV